MCLRTDSDCINLKCVFFFYRYLYFSVCLLFVMVFLLLFFFFQAEDGIRDLTVTGVQTCALPISRSPGMAGRDASTFDFVPSVPLFLSGQRISLTSLGSSQVSPGTPRHRPTAISDVATKAVPFHVQVADHMQSPRLRPDRKSTRLNSSHSQISYAVFCLKKKKKKK